MIRPPAARPAPLKQFLFLIGVELVIAGVLTFTIATIQNTKTTSLLIIIDLAVGVMFLCMPFFLKYHAEMISKVVTILSSGYGQLGIFVVPMTLSAFLFAKRPGVETLQMISVTMVCLWLIGIEALFFFSKSSQRSETAKGMQTNNFLAFISLLFGYGILLLPSRLPTLLDGVPLNTPLEFVVAMLLLPFIFFFGRNFFSQKVVALLLTCMFIVKLLLSLFLPQTGLGIQVYYSEEALTAGQWERTYQSFLSPSYSEVTQLPYRSFYEFPIEAINHHGFEKENFWMAMKIKGAISMQKDERLVFLIQGTQERQINMLVGATQETIPVITAKSSDDLDSQLFNNIPYVQNAEINGLLFFNVYGNGRFEPVILKPDGSFHSAFTNIWLSPSALEFPFISFQYLLNSISLLLAGVILLGLIHGVVLLYSKKAINSIDLYLALSGLILYYLADRAGKPDIHLLFTQVLFLFALIKILDFTVHTDSYPGSGVFFAIGIPILLMFLPLDIHHLQSVVILPQYQDSLDYQMLARNIYVGGDVFLLQSPPWAYKVLFPYVIGLIHILFGQSLSAQFFINVWCAFLSMLLMMKLSNYFGVSKRSSFMISILFFLLLLRPLSFILFFRFGLIEPLAIFTLLLAAYFAKNGKYYAMFAIGVLTGMLRLNFAGTIFTIISFLSTDITGGVAQAWRVFFNWCMLNWKRLIIYLVAIPLPSLLVAYGYTRFHPDYHLTHSMNDQTSIWSVLESLTSVIAGGDREFISVQIEKNPIDLILITTPILFGILAALLSFVYRKGIFARLDLRLSFFLLSMLPVYMVLKPVGYFPRYSWSFLPPALMLLALLLQFRFSKVNNNDISLTAS